MSGTSRILKLTGSSALSGFRRRKLLSSLGQVAHGIEDITAEFIHFVQLKRDLSMAERRRLEQVLRYGPILEDGDRHTAKGAQFVVVPRIGTISPWSSKATDIAQLCGLACIRRLERGIAYRVAPADAANSVRESIAGLLHDRMTECVLDNIAAANALFETHDPADLVNVDVLGRGRGAL